MVHEQSACTHTSLAHAVARFQLALASELEGILKSQVILRTMEVQVCVSGASVSHLALVGGVCIIIYSHDALYRLAIATLSLKACLVLVG